MLASGAGGVDSLTPVEFFRIIDSKSIVRATLSQVSSSPAWEVSGVYIKHDNWGHVATNQFRAKMVIGEGMLENRL